MSEVAHPLETKLRDKIATIEQVLPTEMAGQADRFIKRALLYFFTSKQEKLRQCTPASFVLTVINAAEFGLALDGRLAHAVPRECSIKKTLPDGTVTIHKEMQASLNIDYKGLIVVAKRMGIIQDGWSRLVGANEQLTIRESNGVCEYEFEPNPFNPGQPMGVFTVVTHSQGWWRVDWMTKEEVESVRKRSPAGDYGPWVSDWNEMAKKTGLRRILKTFTEDAGVMSRAMEFSGTDIELEDTSGPKRLPKVRATRLTRQEQPAGLPNYHETIDVYEQQDEPELAVVEQKTEQAKPKNGKQKRQREPGDESEHDGQLFDHAADAVAEGM